MGFPDCVGVGFWNVCLVHFSIHWLVCFQSSSIFHHEVLRLLFLLFCVCLFLKSLRSCVLYLIRDFVVCVGCMDFVSNYSMRMFSIWLIKGNLRANCNLISSHIECGICIS